MIMESDYYNIIVLSRHAYVHACICESVCSLRMGYGCGRQAQKVEPVLIRNLNVLNGDIC